MASVRSLLWEYTRAVFGRVVLLLAGVLGVILLLISLVTPAFTRKAGIALVVTAVVLGQFLAWKDMRTERDRAIQTHETMRLTSPGVTTPGYRVSVSRGLGGEPPRETTWPERWRFHIAQGEKGIDLMCQKWFRAVPLGIECEVEDPDGLRWRAKARQSPDTTARSTYPQDFEGATPKSGTHLVRWQAEGSGFGLRPGLGDMTDPLDFTADIGGQR
jgi:hypothetical protein